MKYKTVIIDHPEQNLKPINLDNLGSVVAFVGKNGSGKSRLLSEITEYYKSYAIPDLIKFIDFNMPYDNWIKSIRTPSNLGVDDNDFFWSSIKSRIKTIKHNTFVEPDKKSVPAMNFLRLDLKKNAIFDEKKSAETAKLIPKQHKLVELINAKTLHDIDINISSETITLGLLEIVNHLLREDYNVLRKNKKEEDTVYYKHFSRLKYWVDKFLDTEIEAIDIDTNSSADFNGTILFKKFPYNFSLLSPGQRILLGYAFYFSLFEAKANINAQDCIFIIDEPENHLHPETQIQLIRALKEIIKDKGQLWIATHSIHIIAELNYDEIFLVKDGVVYPPNRNRPGEVLAELLGIRKNTEILSEFIADTTKWAETNFVMQCLNNPNIFLNPKKNDPEIAVFAKAIESSESIKLLDFGAGKGRLGIALQEDNELLKRIALYDAFEPKMADAFPKLQFDGTLILDISSLNQDVYDIVVLIGVLHEIDLKSLNVYLNKAIETLNKKGVLLIIEDLLFPFGELPNEQGYFVFNNDELELLFSLKEGTSTKINSDITGYEDRIQGTLIHKSHNPFVSEESILSAILALQERCLLNIRAFRKQKDNIANGRQYAFYCQQYINCELVLKSSA